MDFEVFYYFTVKIKQEALNCLYEKRYLLYTEFDNYIKKEALL